MYVNSKRVIKKFEVELSDENGNSVKINVNPPKVKFLEKFKSLSSDTGINEMLDITLEILNNNEEKTLISNEFLENALDVISFTYLFEDLVEWINGIEKK